MSCLTCNTPVKKCKCEITYCTNPIIYFLDEVKNRMTESIAMSVAATAILTDGLLINSSEVCCSDCTGKYGFYYLGNNDGFGTVTGLFDQNLLGARTYPCCVNKRLTSANSDNFYTSFGNKLSCCETGFSGALKTLLTTYTTDDTLVDAGVIEASAFDGISGLKIMLDYIKRFVPAVSSAELTAFITAVFNPGLVIKCHGCQVIICSASSANTIFTGIGLL